MKMIKGSLQQAAVNHALFAQGDSKQHHTDTSVDTTSATGHFSTSDLRPALLLFPLFLAMAFYSIVPAVSVDGLLFTGLSFAGVSLLLLAAQASHIRNSLTGIVALSFYSAVLAFTAVFASAGNSLVWAMVLALPLEIWLVTRHRAGIVAGCVIAITLIAISVIKGVNTQQLMPAGLSTAFLFTYVGALLLRVLLLTVRVKDSHEEITHNNSADSDLETVLDALVIRLDKDGHIRSLSERSVEQFGVERAVLTGTLLLDRVHVADRVQYLAFLSGLRHEDSKMRLSGKTQIRLRCVETGAVENGAQAKIYFSTFEMEGQARYSRDDEGFLLVARNMEQAQEVQNRFIKQSATIENLEVSRTRMLGTVSHELRTPLNSIIGFSDLLLHDVAGPLQSDKQREYIDLIRKSGNHLLEVVNGILEASRLESGQYPITPECFAVRDSVKMCNAMLMPLAEKKGIVLCDRIHPSVTDIVADRRAVQQMLINLVSNAIKFTDRGGCVTIDVMPEEIKQGYSGAPQHLVISVSDTGIGLDAREIERLCQPFTQINNVQTRMQEGSGLGLYLVKGLVSLHQGEMDIRSRKGHGTTVSIRLPIQQVVDNMQYASDDATDQAASDPIMHTEHSSLPESSSFNVSSALEQVKTTLINIQAQQAESSYDGKKEPQRHETQGNFHAQKRKTA